MTLGGDGINYIYMEYERGHLGHVTRPTIVYAVQQKTERIYVALVMTSLQNSLLYQLMAVNSSNTI